MLLHRGRKDIKGLAERLWYPIWDTGIGLDHSVRTVSEALDVADGNLSAASGMLELRHVAGDPALCAELSDRAHQRWRAAARRRLPELAEVGARAAAERSGEIAFLLEPDLKEGTRRPARRPGDAGARRRPGPSTRRARRCARPTGSCSTSAASCTGAPASRPTG